MSTPSGMSGWTGHSPLQFSQVSLLSPPFLEPLSRSLARRKTLSNDTAANRDGGKKVSAKASEFLQVLGLECCWRVCARGRG